MKVAIFIFYLLLFGFLFKSPLWSIVKSLILTLARAGALAWLASTSSAMVLDGWLLVCTGTHESILEINKDLAFVGGASVAGGIELSYISAIVLTELLCLSLFLARSSDWFLCSLIIIRGSLRSVLFWANCTSTAGIDDSTGASQTFAVWDLEWVANRLNSDVFSMI